jgi:hypothetical protein
MPPSCGIPSHRPDTLPRISGSDRARALRTARRTTRTHPHRDDKLLPGNDFRERRSGRITSKGRDIPGSSEGSRCHSADRSWHRGRFRKLSRISGTRRYILDACSWKLSLKEEVMPTHSVGGQYGLSTCTVKAGLSNSNSYPQQTFLRLWNFTLRKS